MHALAYEGYFKNGRFYASGKAVPIPEKKRVYITILDDTHEDAINVDESLTTPHNSKLQFDFVTTVPPLPDSFFDPLPEEELELWGL